MSKYKKGIIILVPFPFSDKLEEKIRPAVIVSNKTRHNSVIVAFITSKSKKWRDDSIVMLNKNEKCFKHARLKISSSIYLSQLATISFKKILGRLGSVDAKKNRRDRQ